MDLLATLKAEKLRVDQWREKEATRDAVSQAIYDFLHSDQTGLPVDRYDETEVKTRADEVYRHVYRVPNRAVSVLRDRCLRVVAQGRPGPAHAPVKDLA